MRPRLSAAAGAVLGLLLAAGARAQANQVIHQQNLNLTGGTCGNYLDQVIPNSTQSYTLRFKVEFSGDTSQGRVYFTTDGSAPSGALGLGTGTTQVVTGIYSCSFFDLGQAKNVDVVTATIPAQAAATPVRYIVSAWNTVGTTLEIFANSGTCATCTACLVSTCADVFQYVVVAVPTSTPTRTSSPTPTRTPSPTVTASPTQTATATPTVTLTRTPTRTFTPVFTATPTASPTRTNTPTITRTPTITLTPSSTPTVTPTRTPAPTAPPAIDLPFFALTPCRLFDTRRLPVGPLAGPALQAGTSRSFQAEGNCGVPLTARAISINLTVTQPTTAGFLTVYPAGSDLPSTSTSNYSANQTRANNAVVLLGPSGDFAVFCGQASGTAHALVDVNGYFE